MQVRDRRVTLMGLGRHGGGVVAARWLAQQGARLTVTDRADAAALADSIAALADVPIAQWRLGEHCAADFDRAEIVVVNPAVRRDDPLVARAAEHGARITTELELFLARFSGQAIGVTGSNGKSTTTAMIAEILRAAGRDVYLGGNIGRSLLADLDRMDDRSWAILEVSSFQLAWLSEDCPRPRIGVLTNFTPNHLDWHESLDDYAAAKRRLFNGPAIASRGPSSLARTAVISADECARRPWIGAVDAPCVIEPIRLVEVPELLVPGLHNRHNASSAIAAALAAGCPREACDAALRRFAGLPHRLEFVAEIAGRRFYNDSMSTTPESTLAALDTFDQCCLLAGGYDKGVDLAAVASAAARRSRATAFFGATGLRMHDLARRESGPAELACERTLDDALAWCWQRSRPGDAVVLSPACASYDQFVDYRHRGEHFMSLVRALGESLAAQGAPS